MTEQEITESAITIQNEIIRIVDSNAEIGLIVLAIIVDKLIRLVCQTPEKILSFNQEILTKLKAKILELNQN